MADNTMAQSRVCTKCKLTLPATKQYFYASPLGRYGLKAICKKCHNEAARKDAKAAYDRDPTKRLAACRRYREKHLDKARERERERATRSYGSKREYRRAWINQNRDRVRATGAAVYAKRRTLETGAGGSYTAQDVQRLLESQGRKCFYCDVELSKWHVDHFIPIAKGGSSDPSNLRISCAFCNQSKGSKLPWEWKPARFSEEKLGQ